MFIYQCFFFIKFNNFLLQVINFFFIKLLFYYKSSFLFIIHKCLFLFFIRKIKYAKKNISHIFKLIENN